MALGETASPTPWGSLRIKMGATGASDAMCATMEDLGAILDEDFSITTEAGETYELKDINGKLLDMLQKEPTLKIGFSLTKLSEKTRGKFWTVSEEGTEGSRKLKVTSLVQNAHQSICFYNEKAIGSETFEAAKCLVSMELNYAKDKGFYGKCEATLMWPDTEGGELFQFGKVASV